MESSFFATAISSLTMKLFLLLRLSSFHTVRLCTVYHRLRAFLLRAFSDFGFTPTARTNRDGIEQSVPQFDGGVKLTSQNS